MWGILSLIRASLPSLSACMGSCAKVVKTAAPTTGSPLVPFRSYNPCRAALQAAEKAQILSTVLAALQAAEREHLQQLSNQAAVDSAARDTAKQIEAVKAQVAKLDREIEAVQRGAAATKVISAFHFPAC